jgi:hypothetical protein
MLPSLQDWPGFEMVGIDDVFDVPELSELSWAHGSSEDGSVGAGRASRRVSGRAPG